MHADKKRITSHTTAFKDLRPGWKTSPRLFPDQITTETRLKENKDRLKNAEAVRRWCKKNDYPYPMTPEQLAVGMGFFRIYQQLPDDYISLINAVIAMEMMQTDQPITTPINYLQQITNINAKLNKKMPKCRVKIAKLIYHWCKKNDHPYPMTPEQLAVGMGFLGIDHHWPGSYLFLINAVIAMEMA